MTKFKALLAALALVAGGLVAAQPAQAVSLLAPSKDVVSVPRPSPEDLVVNPNPKNKDKHLPPAGKGYHDKASAYKQARIAPSYSYAIAEDNQSSEGMMSDVQITKPWLSPAESHTLWEMSVCDDVNSATRDCFEMGWTIDNTGTVNGNTTDPYLFVGYWKDGVFQGYNGGANYHDYAANTTIYAGISLNGAVGGTRYMRIYRDPSNGFVWFGYGTGTGGSTWFDWVGYVATSTWTNPPVTFGTNQWFGEVVSTTRTQASQCTDMLSNVTPTTTAGHLTSGMDLYSNVNPDDISVRVSPSGVGRGSVRVSSTSARMGGPGLC